MGVAHTDHGGTIVKCLNGNGRYHDGKQCGKCSSFGSILDRKMIRCVISRKTDFSYRYSDIRNADAGLSDILQTIAKARVRCSGRRCYERGGEIFSDHGHSISVSCIVQCGGGFLSCGRKFPIPDDDICYF